MGLMTTEEARALMEEFVPQFSTREAYEISIRACFERLQNQPSYDSARRWLSEDLEGQRRLEQMLPPPERPYSKQDFALNACSHCKGKQHLSRGPNELSVPCPVCTGADDPANHCDDCRAQAAAMAEDESERTIRRDYIAELAKKLRTRPKRKVEAPDAPIE